MLTNKGKYGLKAMVHLAELPPGAFAQVVEIAEANSISEKFLSHILTELRRAGSSIPRRERAAAMGSRVPRMRSEWARSCERSLAPSRRSHALPSRPSGHVRTAQIWRPALSGSS